MPAMMSELYDALISAGASEEKSRKAAESQAGFDNRYSKIESELTLIKWMVGVNIAFIIAVLTLLLRK